ncbi:MAG: hypothetical protein H3C31_11170 [Brumimicrobium sp.]|nr:hypothetical protein [Brumimicrobium sp.]MCO5268502.1 hypothetical protein [Brumimicrobium sp.]
MITLICTFQPGKAPEYQYIKKSADSKVLTHVSIDRITFNHEKKLLDEDFTTTKTQFSKQYEESDKIRFEYRYEDMAY